LISVFDPASHSISIELSTGGGEREEERGGYKEEEEEGKESVSG
jgi:hypothetical protein